MIRRWIGVLSLALALVTPLAGAQGTGVLRFKATAVGDEVWPVLNGLDLWFKVPRPTRLTLRLYSPGLDPKDYRAALRGEEELGDERYDGGLGRVRAYYGLFREGRALAEALFAEEPHAWATLFEGELPAGNYLFRHRFYGKAKNAFLVEIHWEGTRPELLLDPKPTTLDIFGNPGATLRQLPGERGQAQELLRLRVDRVPVEVGFFDEDGPEEILAWVEGPEGLRPRPVSLDLEWRAYPLEAPGLYRFLFAQAPTAQQYSNTIAFRIGGCASLEGFDGAYALRVVAPGPRSVEVLDPEGRPLDIRVEEKEGFFRPLLPEGYRLQRVETEGGVVQEDGVYLGCPGGMARFVVAPPPPPPKGEVLVRGVLVLGEREVPTPVALRLGEEEGRFEERSFLLPPGEYPLQVLPVEGARVEAPSRVRVEAGARLGVTVRVRPEVRLELTPSLQRLAEGERGRLEVRATTPFPGPIPAELELLLPEGLTPLGPTRITAPLGQSRPVVLEVPVEGVRGLHEVQARLSPFGLTQRAQVEIYRQASFRLEKRALTPEAPLLGEARFLLQVVNEGDEAGSVTLEELPEKGLAPVDPSLFPLRLALGPGEGKAVEVSYRVEAGGTLTNRARLLQEGRLLAEAQAQVQALLPKPTLSRGLPHALYLPGEVVEHTLVVGNQGQAPLRYRLLDTCPGFLDPASAEFTGVLGPGETRVHTYQARVLLGPEAEGVCEAQLVWALGVERAGVRLGRRPLLLTKEVAPARILEGAQAVFTIRVKNPVDHPVRINLKDLPPQGLKMEPLDLDLTLAPGEEKVLALEATAPIGQYTNRALVFLGESPAALPAEAVLEVLPVLYPERQSQVRIPFKVEGEGDLLLLAHRLPEGASYQPGSARLNGQPLEDPRRDREGRLIWRLPFDKEGVLSYTLFHTQALPALPEPELTLLARGREVYLRGQITLRDYEGAEAIREARRGLIREPQDGLVLRDRDTFALRIEAPLGPIRVLLNGEEVPPSLLGRAEYDEGQKVQRLEYFGLPLKEGRNLVEVEAQGGYDRVEVFRPGTPVRLVAELVQGRVDGRTPIEVRVRALDASGLATGFGPLSVESDLEALNPDAFLQLPGYQVLLRDGEARVLFRPLPAPREFSLKARFNELGLEARFFAGAREGALWLAQGSVTVGLTPLSLSGLARGYVEAPLGGGQFQGALDTTGGLGRRLPQDPPLTGSGEEARRPLTSDDPIAFRYDDPSLTLAYERAPLAPGLPEATGLRLETRGETRFSLALALLPEASLKEEILPDGTSVYRLSHVPRIGSLRLILQEGARERVLQEGRDYVQNLDYIYLSQPLFPWTPQGEPVRLVALYAPEEAPRTLLGLAVGGRYEAGGWSLGLGGAYRFSLTGSAGPGLYLGGEVMYRSGASRFGLRATWEEALKLALEGQVQEGLFRFQGNLLWQEGQGLPTGSVRAGVEEGAFGVYLEGQNQGLQSQVGLLAEWSPRPLVFGVGVGYLLREAAWALLFRTGYREGGAEVLLTHTQPFGVRPNTLLSARIPLLPGLSAEGSLAYLWGEGFSGTLGLRSQVGGGNLALYYDLPTASGEGNRARFGLEAPFPLTDRLALNLTLGAERDLGRGEGFTAFGLALRYRTDDFVATLGPEVRLGQETRFLVRGGAAGSLDAENTLGADLALELFPEPRGRFTLAYAYRGPELSLLTYHRLGLGEKAEGEALLSYFPFPSFQLRPSLAYRYPFPDPQGLLLQAGLGLTLYPLERFSLGGAVYWLGLPYLAEGRFTAQAEFGVKVLDGLWLNLGYGFGPLLFTPEGFYLRLDLFGGSR